MTNTQKNSLESEEKSSEKNNPLTTNRIMNILQNQKPDNSIEGFIKTDIEAKQKEELERLSAERKEKKLKILKKEMNMSEADAKNRPTLDFLDENILQNIENASDSELQNIIEFMARQNIACAMGCCGDKTYPERIEEIVNIHNKNMGGKFLHFHLYQELGWTKEDWEKAIKADSEEALEYFQVYLKNTPQDETTRKKLLQEFARIYFLAKEKSEK